jgi:hypothetical protein
LPEAERIRNGGARASRFCGVAHHHVDAEFEIARFHHGLDGRSAHRLDECQCGPSEGQQLDRHRQVKMLWLGRVRSEGYWGGKTTSRDAGYRYPAEIISYAVWLYFRFPLSLRMVEEMLAAREIGVSHETVRQWGLKFGEVFARRVRQHAPQRGDKWHLDEVVITIAGRKHWLWRAVDQHGFVLDVLVQSRRNTKVAGRLLRKLLKRNCQVNLAEANRPLPRL